MSKAAAPKARRSVTLSEAGLVEGRLMERVGCWSDCQETFVFGEALNLNQNDEAEL